MENWQLLTSETGLLVEYQYIKYLTVIIGL